MSVGRAWTKLSANVRETDAHLHIAHVCIHLATHTEQMCDCSCYAVCCGCSRLRMDLRAALRIEATAARVQGQVAFDGWRSLLRNCLEERRRLVERTALGAEDLWVWIPGRPHAMAKMVGG